MSDPAIRSHFPRGMLITALLGASAGALVAGIDGFRSGSPMLTALALDLALAALACWWAIDAENVRRRQAASGDFSAENGAESNSSSPQAANEGAIAALTVEAEAAEAARRMTAEARTMHFIFLSVPAVIVVAFAAFRLWADFVGVSSPLSAIHATAAAVVALAASCIWIVLSESFVSIPPERLPESAALAHAFRDARWASIAAAVGLLGSQAVAGLDVWIGRGLGLWVLIVGLEQTIRALWQWFSLTDGSGPFTTPIALLSREAVLVRGNPLASLFDTIESRFGLSFRSSWSIRFVRAMTAPIAVFLGLIVWGFSALTIIEVHQFGVEERFGRVVPSPLAPGLHATLPWPFGRVLRYPVKTVSTMRIGFQEDESAAKKLGPRAMLWTQSHAKEYALVLGTQTEVVAVNAVISYKIHEDAERFLDYVYRAQNPEARLETCAYRSLLEETCSATLAKVLTEDRLAFATRLRDRLRRYAEEERLGIDVIDVGIVNLHPPVEVAGDYLDVISAGIDASRLIEEARAESQVRLLNASGEGKHLTAQARIDAAKRIGRAAGESPEFAAAARAYTESPEATRSRLWFDAMEKILEGKRIFLLDSSVARGDGELLLDLRPPSSAPLTPRSP